MMQRDRVTMLLEITDLVRERGAADLTAWLVAGVDAFLSGENLGSALGLTGTARQAWLHSKRNGLIHEAGRLIGGDDPWDIASDLAEEIRTFNRAWQRLKKIAPDKRPPSNRLREILCEVADLGLPVPLTAERLYQILQAHESTTNTTKSGTYGPLVDRQRG